MQPSGTARTEVTIEDKSILVNTGAKGIIGVMGVTAIGPVDTPIIIGSWLEFQRTFGDLLPGVSDFPLLCRRALETGSVRLKVSRVGHYTSIADNTTLVGVKASSILGTVGSGTASATFTAAAIGSGYNGYTATIADPANGNVNTKDITIVGPNGYKFTYPNFPTVSTSTDVATFNARSKYVKLTVGANNTLPTNGTAVLVNGAQVVGNIVSTDYIGDEGAGTGMHAFDESTDIVKIAVPEKSVIAIDAALITYAENRGDILAYIHAPAGVDADTAVDYREGTGTFTHTAYDSWYGFMTMGGLLVNNPVTLLEQEVTEAGDIVGVFSRKDNKTQEWFTGAGSSRGRLRNCNGIVYNVGVASRQSQADNLDNHGINPVINHPNFGPVLWGNRTLYKAPSLLRHLNVAELLISLKRRLTPLIQASTFDPNDIETWQEIHRKVVPELEYIKGKRGIWRYLYQGDQDIDDISQAVVNSSDDIDAGSYKFNLFIAPKVGMIYQGVSVILANSGVKFEDLGDTPPIGV